MEQSRLFEFTRYAILPLLMFRRRWAVYSQRDLQLKLKSTTERTLARLHFLGLDDDGMPAFITYP